MLAALFSYGYAIILLALANEATTPWLRVVGVVAGSWMALVGSIAGWRAAREQD